MSAIASVAAAEIARDLNITLPDSLAHVASVFEAKRELVAKIAGMPFDRAARLLMLHAWQREPLSVAGLSLALLATIQETEAKLRSRDALLAEKDTLIEELRASLDIRTGRRGPIRLDVNPPLASDDPRLVAAVGRLIEHAAKMPIGDAVRSILASYADARPEARVAIADAVVELATDTTWRRSA